MSTTHPTANITHTHTIYFEVAVKLPTSFPFPTRVCLVAQENMPSRPLYSCAVYISSGLQSVASRCAAAAALVPRVAIVDVFSDPAYARSSVKLVAEAGPLVEAAEAAAVEAMALVDLSEEPHPAPHPRQGAVDMISFMPLSERSASAIRDDLNTCDSLAWQLGESLGGHGCPVLMYGERAHRTLVETRRGTSFFRSTRANAPRDATTVLPLDFGAGAAARAEGDAGGVVLPQGKGVSIVGVQPYVTNFNVAVRGASLDACRSAATALRDKFGVQVMALPHADELHEIGCNLQATEVRDSPDRDEILALIQASLPGEASIARSYVIGLTPGDALAKGEALLDAQGHAPAPTDGVA